mmetsp:Transcript_5949/g.25124  ORF Transcript_5949/g.25124 Transcript_5949/m.25124 type:complete len:135 (-) Transcript_5949:764-1168(-)
MISSYRGVSWNKKNKAWQARIRYGRDVLSLGYFDCDKRAAQAFDIMSLRIHKDLAKTNFPFGNYDRRIFEDKPLSEVVYMARALSRKRRRSGDDEQEREWERVALEVFGFTWERTSSISVRSALISCFSRFASV